MHYLYHRVPNDFKGALLYPLNQLRSVFPEVYEKEHSKYVGRESVTKQRIPLFNNCLWNDVLFLTALHPQKLFDARREAGWPDLPPQRYFKIDPNSLDGTKLGVYLFTHRPGEAGRSLSNEDFVPYRYEDLSEYAVVPQETRDYFKAELEKGEPRIRLFYRYIPHVLYDGPIDTTGLEIITVQ